MANELMNTFDSGTDIVTRASFNARIEQANTNFVAGNTELLGAMPNKNLLHNWDFRNPVNQRGLTTYVRSGASYCIDRWNMPNGDANTSVVVGNGYIEKTFAGTLGVLSSIGQDLEPRTIEGGLIYTLSAFVEAGVNCAIAIRVYNLTTATFILQDSVDVVANTKTLVSKNFVMTGVSPTDTIRIIIGSWTATSLKYYSAKLELGYVSTLANDPPADYGEQLALCQRYCFVTNNHSRWLRASYINANIVYFDIPIPVNMRVNPSIESASGLRILSPIVSGPEATGFTFAVASASPISSLRLAGTKTAHGLTDAVLDAVKIVFSADL